MTRPAIPLLAAALLAACAPRPAPPPAAAAAAAPAAPVCRVDPDGGPPAARIAERGIGGTGAPATRIAERGIGGTGIIGVVTGFASICLAGQEVAIGPATQVEIAGAPASPAALRAGQVAAIAATGRPDALQANRVVVRYEVAGPVDRIMPDQLVVAGQTVILTAETWLQAIPRPGLPVAVSGLRDATGAIRATRIDVLRGPVVTVHGIVGPDGQIGALPITAPEGRPLAPGMVVTATGTIEDGRLLAETLQPDLLAADPVAYFGPQIDRYVVESFGWQPDGARTIGGLLLQPPAGSRPLGRSIANFQRTPSGIRIDSVATPGAAQGPAQGAAPTPPAPPSGSNAGPGNAPPNRRGPAGAFEPAPMPDRSLANDPGRFAPGRDGGGIASGQPGGPAQRAFDGAPGGAPGGARPPAPGAAPPQAGPPPRR